MNLGWQESATAALLIGFEDALCSRAYSACNAAMTSECRVAAHCVISPQVARGRLVSINRRNDTQRHGKGTYKSLVSSMCSLRRSMRASRPPAGVMPLARH